MSLKSFRGLLALAALLLTLSACGTETVNGPSTVPPTLTAVTASARPTDPPQVPSLAHQCALTGASIVVGIADAAMGQRLTTLVLTNCGSESYRLDGYPQLTVLDQDRRPVAVAVARASMIQGVVDPGPKPIVLAPQASAITKLTWRSTVLIGEPDATGSYIAVSPGQQHPMQIVPVRVDDGTTAQIAATAWEEFRK
jgi:predicted small lipoprotein YifL